MLFIPTLMICTRLSYLRVRGAARFSMSRDARAIPVPRNEIECKMEALPMTVVSTFAFQPGQTSK